MPTTDDHKIHVIVFRSGEWLIAQCLEFDIATQVREFPDLFHEVERILAAHIVVEQKEGLEPFADISKAPRKFWVMYRDAKIQLQPITPKTPEVRYFSVELRIA